MDIYELVKSEEKAYQTRGVMVTDSWEWKMYDHIKRSTLYKNSQFESGAIGDKPFKNIIRPILNVAYRSEGFDVKDIVPFVNDAEEYYKSFLVRKFHEKWARKNNLDTAIDDSVETYCDYGGVLVKRVGRGAPEIVPWQEVAFCDQADILSGTLGLKHSYTIDQLQETVTDLKWYKDQVDLAIFNAISRRTNSQSPNRESKSPQKNIDVYEVHGMFPEDWLSKDGNVDYNDALDADKYVRQVHIITFIEAGQSNNKLGITLYKGKEKDSIFKFLKRDKVFGRALGTGGVEELFEPQIWTNFSEIHKMEMLKQASKIIYQTSDTGFTTRNNTRNAEQGAVFVHDGNPATLLNNQPINLPAFDKASEAWEMHARTTGSANDAQLGINPTSGTPFALQNLVTSTGQGIHEYRQGKIASFWGEIYRDWILQDLVDDMNEGDEWMEELSLDELQEVSDSITDCAFNDFAKKKILSGQAIDQEMLDSMKQKFKQDIMKSSKKFLTLAQDEFAEIPVDVEVNIAGKQKDLGRMSDKLTNIFRTIFANPQGFMETMKIPGAAKAFNTLMEASGLDQFDFSQMPPTQPQQPAQPAQPSPVQPNQLPNNQPANQ